jgi:2-oxoglutarate ferredoxin oxidoreductase subunit gamma
MTEEIIIAGFGGQGVLSMGKFIALSGMVEGKEVSWIPSYGPEMRGGTANVMVIISDEKISSPMIYQYDTAILLNQQSIEKFVPDVKPGGLILYDSQGVKTPPDRKDVHIYCLNAMQEASDMGAPKIYNMIVLGAFLKAKPIVKIENVVDGLKKGLPERYHHLIPKNIEGLHRGQDVVQPVHVLG